MSTGPNRICPALAECRLSAPDEPYCGMLPEHAPVTALAAPDRLCANALRGIARRCNSPRRPSEKVWINVERALVDTDATEATRRLKDAAHAVESFDAAEATPDETIETKFAGAYLRMFEHAIHSTEPSIKDFADLQNDLGQLLDEVINGTVLTIPQESHFKAKLICFYLLARGRHGNVRPASSREQAKHTINKSERHDGYVLSPHGKTPFYVVMGAYQKGRHLSPVHGLSLGAICDDSEALCRVVLHEAAGKPLSHNLAIMLEKAQTGIYRELQKAEALAPTPPPLRLAEDAKEGVLAAPPTGFPRGPAATGWRELEYALYHGKPGNVTRALETLSKVLRPSATSSFESKAATSAELALAFRLAFLQRALREQLTPRRVTSIYKSLGATIEINTPTCGVPDNPTSRENYALAIGLLAFARIAVMSEEPSLLVLPASPREQTIPPIKGVKYAHNCYQIPAPHRKLPYALRFQQGIEDHKSFHPDLVPIFVGNIAAQTLLTTPSLYKGVLNDPRGDTAAALDYIGQLLGRESQGHQISTDDQRLLNTFCDALMDASEG